MRTQSPGRSLVVHFCVRNGSEWLKKAVFCVRNGSVMPRKEGFAKQTPVMLLEGWSTDDVTAEANPVSIKWSRCWTVPRKQNGSLW